MEIPGNVSIKRRVLRVEFLISPNEGIFLNLPDFPVGVPCAQVVLQVLSIALHAGIDDVLDLLHFLVPRHHFTNRLCDDGAEN